MTTTLRFLGAAKNVTGSCTLVEHDGFRLLVDCGLYQERDYRQRNWDAFPEEPGSIDAVLLTHAHLDHCGLLPKLVKEGFRGRIYCTPATADIADIVLKDSGKIQEEDIAFKKRRHEQEGRTGPFPYEPLYTIEEAEAVTPRFTPVEYDRSRRLADGIEVDFQDAGHILGSSMIRLRIDGGVRRTLVFSGDIGRWGTPILRDPTLFDQADYMVTESTYGHRDHGDSSGIPGQLAEIINRIRKAGGNIVIPSFAVERTQELLYHLGRLLADDAIPHLMAFVDSPMAAKVTDVFRRHPELFDEEARGLIERGEHPCDFPGLVITRTIDQSKSINHIQGSILIIAGSGMCTGGRIKHHLAKNIGDENSAVLFIGYQARGTLGRLIVDGAEEVRILGQTHAVKASIERISGFSAHADRSEIMRWLSAPKKSPRKIFVSHGEEEAVAALGRRIRDEIGCPVEATEYGAVAGLE